MNKTTLLFIRACKAGKYSKKRNKDTRIHSVFRHHYFEDTPENTKRALISILSVICETYNLITVTKLLTELDPYYVFRTHDDYDYIDRCYDTLVSAIRYASVDKFPEYIPSTHSGNGLTNLLGADAQDYLDDPHYP